MKTTIQKSYGLHLSCLSLIICLPFDLYCVLTTIQRMKKCIGLNYRCKPLFRLRVQTIVFTLSASMCVLPMAPNVKTPMASGCSGPKNKLRNFIRIFIKNNN